MVTVRYYAGARAAAGVDGDTAPAGVTLAQLVADLTERRGAALGAVLAASSYLVDGAAWHDRDARLPAGVTLDVLPPFAGG